MTRTAGTITIDRERFPVDAWRLVETRLGDDDGGLTGTLFAIGNGYLGLRADWAPDPQSAGTYVNGFHETFPIIHAEHAYAIRPHRPVDAQRARRQVDRARRSAARCCAWRRDHPDRSEVTDFRREIDFRSGVLHVGAHLAPPRRR